MVSFTTTAESVVKPSSPTPPQHMFLAAGDIVWRWFHYNQRVLFFRMPPTSSSSSSSSFIAHLKSSLALALVDFFPWAGRLVEQPNGRLALDCNDAGVPFIEVAIDVPFSSLEIHGFQHKPFFKHLAPHSDVLQWTPDLPLLSVQVTRFLRDEGFVLGIGHNHAVADGSSLWHFMKSWAECARGLPISMRPIHMRSAQSPENLILPDPPPRDPTADRKSVTQGGTLDFGPPRSRDKLVQRDFHFSAAMVKKLKAAAAEEGRHDAAAAAARISSLQALSAHIWRRATAARGADKSSRCAFFLIANMRRRCVPPLPDAYFGNAIMRDAAVARAEELQEESIGRTARRIKELAAAMDDTCMKTYYGNMEVLQPSTLIEGAQFTMPKLQLSSSPRFPAYEVDFGWGPPRCVRCPLIRTDGEMVWFAGREGGGSVDVALALTKPAMERLEQDEGFLSIL